MKKNIKAIIAMAVISTYLVSCEPGGSSHQHSEDESEANTEAEVVHFSIQQFKSLDMKIDTLPVRNMNSYVEANGRLEVPPQNEAAVTAIIGANITSIRVIEGEKVSKGKVLAYLSHPNLIRLQTDYVNNWSQLRFLEKEYERQKRLYEENVGSGKEFQKTQADYQSMKALVKGYEAQLKLMGIDLEKVQNSDVYDYVPVITPIDGYIRKVMVKTGQYVEPQTEMFDIVNNDHVHADLMVFEKDMHKVKEGQKVKFSIASMPNKELTAFIFSVGKSFEQDPKAIHLHAEIENKQGLLIPGMYVRGRILVDDKQCYALPESGVVREGDKSFIFVADEDNDHGETEWVFKPIEVVEGEKDDGWVEIKPLEQFDGNMRVAWNNAYYLLAEMKKGEAEHEH